MADSQLSNGKPQHKGVMFYHLTLLLKENDAIILKTIDVKCRQMWIVLIQAFFSTRTQLYLETTVKRDFAVWVLLVYFNNYFNYFWNTANSEVERGSFFNKMQQCYMSSGQEMKKYITFMYKYLKNCTWASCNCFNREIELTAWFWDTVFQGVKWSQAVCISCSWLVRLTVHPNQHHEYPFLSYRSINSVLVLEDYIFWRIRPGWSKVLRGI